MDILTKKRLLIGTIIILIVINISALGTMAFNKFIHTRNVEFRDHNKKNSSENKEKQMKKHHFRMKNFVKKELALSDEQFEQFANLKDVNIEKSKFFRQEIDNRKKMIFKEYCKDGQDTAILYQISDEIGYLHAKMQKETLRHFQATEKILTPEQRVKFREMLCNMSERKTPGYYQKGKKRRRRMGSGN